MNDTMAVWELSYENSVTFLRDLAQNRDLALRFQAQKEYLYAEDESGRRVLEFRYPLVFPHPGERFDPEEFAGLVPDFPPAYLMLLVQAGNAALGIFEGWEVLEHKVIRKYMVRKQQGKAQIKHLKTKGKSRLGSRIRLRNSEAFLEEINQRCEDWLMLNPVERILFSCSENLWHLLFQADPRPPFDRSDPRIRRIPFDVHPPNFEELMRINQKALTGYLSMDPDLDVAVPG